MKQFEYQKYDYSFLYGFLTKKQQEEVENILKRFIGMPNTEATRAAAQMELDNWFKNNNINTKYKYKVIYE